LNLRKVDVPGRFVFFNAFSLLHPSLHILSKVRKLANRSPETVSDFVYKTIA